MPLVTLCGFPSSGKSAVADKLAKGLTLTSHPPLLHAGASWHWPRVPHAIQSLKPVVNGCAFEISKSTSACALLVQSPHHQQLNANGGVAGWWDLDSALALIPVADRAQTTYPNTSQISLWL